MMEIIRAIYMNNRYEGIYRLIKINDRYFWTLKDTFEPDDENIRLNIEWREGMYKMPTDSLFQFTGNFLYHEGDLDGGD